MQDPYANYVMQSALAVTSGQLHGCAPLASFLPCLLASVCARACVCLHVRACLRQRPSPRPARPPARPPLPPRPPPPLSSSSSSLRALTRSSPLPFSSRGRASSSMGLRGSRGSHPSPLSVTSRHARTRVVLQQAAGQPSPRALTRPPWPVPAAPCRVCVWECATGLLTRQTTGVVHASPSRLLQLCPFPPSCAPCTPCTPARLCCAASVQQRGLAGRGGGEPERQAPITPAR